MGRAIAVRRVSKTASRREEAIARLSDSFIAALAEDYAAHGAAALASLRTDKPVDYVKLVAALLPKDKGAAGEGNENGAFPAAIEVRFVDCGGES